MAFSFDFGFESKGASWNDAYLALLFASDGEQYDLGRGTGPIAVADASRYVELFEMQVGLSPFEIGTYAEVTGGSDPTDSAARRAQEARSRGMFPVVVGETRRVTQLACKDPLVALWGKVGRPESNESQTLSQHQTVLGGVRAATSNAFKAIPANVAIITARALANKQEAFRSALEQIADPVHLSIDLDVLAPGVAQSPRSIEPGGLSWYHLMDAIDMVFEGPGAVAIDIVGTGLIQPRTPAALLCAQILIKVAGVLAAGLKK